MNNILPINFYIMKWNELSMSQKADLMKIYIKNGYSSLQSIIDDYNKFDDGGPIGGYPEDTLVERKNKALMWDPTGGFDILSQTIFKGNPTGEEQAYYNTYLGLEENIPKMNPKAKTEWDDKIEAEKISRGELPSDFYGTTPRMDLNIQAIADTLNTGKILRNYDAYKQANPSLPHISKIQRIYNKGKEILDNPNTWHDVDGNVTAIKSKYDSTTDEKEPLGMLSHFGMKWDDANKTIYVHDTYDFPKKYRALGFMPDRPKEMKIRGAINFDPKVGSRLLRDDLKEFNNYPEPIRGSRNFADGGNINLY